MGWVLTILFGSAVVLLVLSFVKAKQSSSLLERQIDQTSFSLMNEINRLQKQIRDLELDTEITAQEKGDPSRNSEERVLLREIIDLHRRGYALQSIAEKKELSVEEVESLLSPYIRTKGERSNIA